MEPQKLIPVGQLFKKSFEFYKSKMYTIMVLALIPFAIFVVISILNEIVTEAPSEGVAVGVGLVASLIFLCAMVVNLWVHVAFFYLIKNLLHEDLEKIRI